MSKYTITQILTDILTGHGIQVIAANLHVITVIDVYIKDRVISCDIIDLEPKASSIYMWLQY